MHSKRSNFEFDIKSEDLERYADGRWPEIIGALAPVIADAAANFGRAGKDSHHQCPFPHRHKSSGGRKKFRLYQGKGAIYTGGAICSCGGWSSGFSLLMEVNGWSYPEVLDEVNTYLGDPCGAAEKRAARKGNVTDAQKAKWRKDAAERRAKADAAAEKARVKREEETARLDAFYKNLLIETYKGVQPISDSTNAAPAWRYLKNRGIDPSVLTKITTAIGYHPNMPYYFKGKEYGRFPAIVSMFRDANNKPATYHRIYISDDGQKADLPANDAKKVMPSPSTVTLTGGAIQLCGYKRVLGLAEGIETALAAYSATGLPTWATYSASLLANFNFESLLDKLDLLVVWADHDRSEAGIKAAETLKARAAEKGLDTLIMLPDQFPIPDGAKGVDWLDVLSDHGKDAFPDMVTLVRNALASKQTGGEA